MIGCMFGCIKAAISGANDNHIEVETGVAHPIVCVEDVILARRLSKSRGTAAAATLRDSTAALWGRVTPAEQQACIRGSSPAPSFPSRSTVGKVQSSSQ